MALVWFHAFRRPGIGDVLQVLRNGPAPLPGSQTQQNERILGIDPPCVYAYLGHTLEEFGDCAISLNMAALENIADVSPFDTGGLVNHLAPVKDWTEANRRAFLNHFSWGADELPELLASYPGTDAASISAYLRGERPIAVGPHEVFAGAGDDASRVAAIWQQADSSRAWLWEGRTASPITVPDNLVRWSCSPSTYQDILHYAEQVVDPEEGTWLAAVVATYVPGGVSALWAELFARQEAA